MSGSQYRYYICDEQKVSSDILRAAIHSEVENFSLHVYAKAGDGRVVYESCGRAIGSGKSALLQTNRQLIDRPGAGPGLAAAAGAALACVLFLPILYSLGQWLFAGLMFLVTLIAAWAGGAFSLASPSSAIRRGLKSLKPEQLFVVCIASETAQQGVHQVLSRYGVVPTAQARSAESRDGSIGRA